MTRYEIIQRCIEEEEGGWKYTDHPDDPDKGTYAGVRFITHERYRERHGIPRINPDEYKRLAEINHPALQQEIIEVYEDFFWDVMRLDHVPNYLRAMVFSAGVNRGTENGILYLQKTANDFAKQYHNMHDIPYTPIKEDGIMGAITMGLVNNYLTVNTGLMRKNIAIKYFYHWQQSYNKLVVDNAKAWKEFATPTDKFATKPKYFRATFLEGWFNRAFKFIMEIE